MISDAVDIRNAIRNHATAEMPREACGLVIMVDGTLTYVPCKNISNNSDQFRIDHNDYADAEERGEIVAVAHSHPNGRALASQADLVGVEDTKLPWIILGWPIDEWIELEPQGYIPPLTGRQFTWGVLDCYTEIRDYYRTALNIEIPTRPADWETRLGTIYIDEFEKYGFVKVEEPQLHDLIIMRIMRQGKAYNHAAIYLGNNIMLQHPEGKLSTHAVYGGVYMKWTIAFLRHSSLIVGAA